MGNKGSGRQTGFVKSAKTLARLTILTAVDELVRREGWTGTTIAAVAHAAGVSRQTVYNEFGSRRSIADAYVMHQLDGLLGSMVTLVRENGVEAGFAKSFDEFFDMAGEPMIQTAMDGERPAVIELIRATNERATTVIADLFHELEPSLAPSDAVVFADSVVRVAIAHAVAPTLHREVAITRIVRLITTLLGRGVAQAVPAPESVTRD